MLVNALKDFFYDVFRGGKTYIYDIEAFALSKLFQSLAEPDKSNFLRQLIRLNFVQRSPDGKIVALYQSSDTYFKSWDEILIKNRQENMLAFRINISGELCPKRSLVIEIYFHQGRISSIEYKGAMEWPSTQEKIRLENFLWQDYKEPDVNVLSSELFV